MIKEDFGIYKIDTHIHTKNTSPCGHVLARDIVALYKKMGYDGIVITDHFYKNFFDALGTLSWDEKINRYLAGYKEAYQVGNQLGLKVLLGIEAKFKDNPNDYLIYGVDEMYLRQNKPTFEISLEAFNKKKSKDILVYQAHPYRLGNSVTHPSLMDGIEVYNGHPRHDSKNHLALKYAKDHHLLALSGSDYHQLHDVGSGGVILSKKIESEKELIEAFRKNFSDEQLIRRI